MLTQSNKIYAWGLANEGRLGVEKVVALNRMDHSLFTAVPQVVKLPPDVRVDNIKAVDRFTYAEATIVGNDAGLGVTQATVYAWGTMPPGLAMMRNEQLFKKPTVLEQFAPYNFSKIKISSNVAFGVGHGVNITFGIPNEQQPEGPRKEVTVLALPIIDKFVTKSTDDLSDALDRLKDMNVVVVNDFDVPLITQGKYPMARVQKKKPKKVLMTVGGDPADEPNEGEENEEDEDEDDDFNVDDDNEEEGSDAEYQSENDDIDGSKDENESGSEHSKKDDKSSDDSAKKKAKAKAEKPLGFRVGKNAKPGFERREGYSRKRGSKSTKKKQTTNLDDLLEGDVESMNPE